jgi:hypothetical protein
VTEQPGQGETPGDQGPTLPQYPLGSPYGSPDAPTAGYPVPAGTVITAEPGRSGLGLAALILGILSILGVIVAGLDVLVAVIGLALGIIGWTRAGGRNQTTTLARTGTILAAVGLVGSVLYTTASSHAVTACKSVPTSNTAVRKQCLKDHFRL